MASPFRGCTVTIPEVPSLLEHASTPDRLPPRRTAAPQAWPPAVSDARSTQRIGDITLTPDTVATPSGLSSTRHVEWQIDDGSTPPRWSGAAHHAGDAAGVVGSVRVTATAPGWKHVTLVPVSTLDEVTEIYAKVLHARRLAQRR